VYFAARADDTGAEPPLELPALRFEHGHSIGLEFPQHFYAWQLLGERTPASLAAVEDLLMTLVAGARAVHHHRQEIYALALLALVCAAQNRAADAAGHLEEALALAAPRGMIRTFVDLGPDMADLLRQVYATTAHRQCVAKLLAAFPVAEARTPVRPAVMPDELLVDPLTARESEVLELLVQRRSYAEIGEALVISPKTVKKHASNIYSKLGVARRSQAVLKARRLGLIHAPYP
jgi:LuxR family maltose regulon positive regulatory protein